MRCRRLSGNRRIACAIRNVSEISAEIDVFVGHRCYLIFCNLLSRTDFSLLTDVACAIKTPPSFASTPPVA